MKKITTTLALSALVALGATSSAHAGPTCAGYGDPAWKNHGEHVLTYVTGDGGAAGGAPAHLTSPPAPGASFCLDQANSPGLHF